MPLINFKIHLELNWSKDYANNNNVNNNNNNNNNDNNKHLK